MNQEIWASLLIVRQIILLLEVYSVVCHKPKVHISLRDDSNIFYNYTSGLIMVPFLSDDPGPFIITWDKRIIRVRSGFDFPHYIKYKVNYENRANKSMSFYPVESHLHYGIQIADFIANAIFQKYERGNTACYDIISPKIKEERQLFF